MDGIAERIEDCGHFLVHIRFVTPDVAHGQYNVLCEGTGAVDTKARGECAQVAASSEAVATASAGDVSLAADDVAGMEVVHVRANLDDLPDKLMSDHHRDRNRLLRPLIPVVDMDVGSAD